MTVGTLEGFARYAIYYTPPSGSAMASVGAAWLGWDCVSGTEPPPPEGLSPALRAARPALTRRPRRYGFHATLKAPFRLASRFSAEELDSVLEAFAASTAPVEGPALTAAHGADETMNFVALVTETDAPEIAALAARCVTQLDLLRAALTPAEMARRRRVGLDTLEDQNLREWGYPYVLRRFRFHITLTGPVSRAEAALIAPELDELLAPTLEWPFCIREIALFGDPGEGGPFRLLKRYALGGGRP